MSSVNSIKGTDEADGLIAEVAGEKYIIFGYGGNDTLFGGTVGDLIDGGLGNDWLYGGNAGGNDTLIGGSGDDRLDVSYGDHNYLYGGDGEDELHADNESNYTLLDGGSGNDDLYASGVGSTLVGGAGNDYIRTTDSTGTVLDGGDGGDMLVAYSSNSSLSGGSGDDTLFAYGFENTLYGGEGNDRLMAEGDEAELYGGDGNDYLYAKGDDNDLNGGEGDDFLRVYSDDNATLFGNEGNDTLYGGNGDDSLFGGDGKDLLDGGEGDDTLLGGVGNDILYGGSGEDFLNGGTGNDTLYGGDGDDYLEGSGGSDLMAGGSGVDIYFVDHAGDKVVEDRNDDETDVVYTTLTSYKLGANVENLFYGTYYGMIGPKSGPGPESDEFYDIYAGTGNFTGTGNELDNAIFGGSGNDKLYGGAGYDYLYGGNGNDALYGGDGNDEILGGAGADTLNGDAGSDILYGGSGNDKLYGGSGEDFLYGAEGKDTMSGGAGNDTYFVDNAGDSVIEAAGGGYDTVNIFDDSITSYTLTANVEALYREGVGSFVATGNAGNNLIELSGVSNDLVYGEAGNDELYAGEGMDTLYGGAGDDTIDGGGNNDILYGGTGNDALYGGAGNNILDGGSGVDTVYLEGKRDDYEYDSATGTYTNLVTYETNVLRNVEIVQFADGSTDILLASKEATKGNDILYGTALDGVNANDTIDGGAGNDYILGLGGDDSLAGGAGNDTLVGGTGADNMEGGFGNDTYEVDDLSDIVIEAAGGGTDTVLTYLDGYTLADNVENVVVANGVNDSDDDQTITATGNGSANVITGHMSFANRLYGDAKNDTLTGGNNDDRLDGGAGDDSMVGGSGSDTYFVNSKYDKVVEADTYGEDAVYTTLTSYTLGANVENLYYWDGISTTVPGVGTGNFTGTGNALNNEICGGAGNDTLNGGAGNDGLFGGAGNDVLNGGTGDDVLNGEDGSNVLNGGDGDDTLHWMLGNDTLNGGNGDDTVKLNLPTGSGALSFQRTATGATVSYTLDSVTYSATLNGIEKVVINEGTPYDLEEMLLNSASDFNDTFKCVDATEAIGGKGNDTYIVKFSSSNVIENLGEGTDTVIAYVNDYTLATNVENLKAADDMTITDMAVMLYGNDLDNVITGVTTTYNNQLSGGAGNDTLYGGELDDHLMGDYDYDNDDIEKAGVVGNDKMIGGYGNDTYYVNSKYDVVVENFAQGYDRVVTSLTEYTLGANVEGLEYRPIASTFVPSGVKFTGNALNNMIDGSDGNDTLDGLAGDDSIYGLNGNDVLKGGAGNDLLYGEYDNDTIYGGAGNDTLCGGYGDDVFVFNTALNARTNVDTIIDFTSGEDKIHLENAIFTKLTKTGALNALNFVIGTDAQDANDYIVYDNLTGALYYDADGSGSGDAVQIATLSGCPTLSAADIVVI